MFQVHAAQKREKTGLSLLSKAIVTPSVSTEHSLRCRSSSSLRARPALALWAGLRCRSSQQGGKPAILPEGVLQQGAHRLGVPCRDAVQEEDPAPVLGGSCSYNPLHPCHPPPGGAERLPPHRLLFRCLDATNLTLSLDHAPLFLEEQMLYLLKAKPECMWLEDEHAEAMVSECQDAEAMVLESQDEEAVHTVHDNLDAVCCCCYCQCTKRGAACHNVYRRDERTRMISMLHCPDTCSDTDTHTDS